MLYVTKLKVHHWTKVGLDNWPPIRWEGSQPATGSAPGSWAWPTNDTCPVGTRSRFIFCLVPNSHPHPILPIAIPGARQLARRQATWQRGQQHGGGGKHGDSGFILASWSSTSSVSSGRHFSQVETTAGHHKILALLQPAANLCHPCPRPGSAWSLHLVPDGHPDRRLAS
jgi:hypothetical protein